MALKPCKVCGALNTEGAEICLSCEYPTDGHKRPVIFRYVAIALVACFALPFLAGLIDWILFQFRPEPIAPSQPKVSSVERPLNLRQKSDRFSVKAIANKLPIKLTQSTIKH